MRALSVSVRRLGSTGLLLVLASGCATAHLPDARMARAEVLDAERRWWRAVSRGEVDHAVRRFSDEAVFEAPDGSRVSGRVALGERLRRDGPAPLEVLGVPDHVHLDSAELAVVTGSLEWTGAPPPGARATGLRYVDTWRRAGSDWRLVTADASPPPETSGASALVREVLAAWSGGDWDGLQALLAPGYRARSDAPGGDRSELRRRFDAFHHAWAEARFDVDEQFETGDRVVTRITATLTEAGTGRTARYAGLDISRVVDGRLADHWDSWELLPAPHASGESRPSTSAGDRPERAEASTRRTTAETSWPVAPSVVAGIASASSAPAD